MKKTRQISKEDKFILKETISGYLKKWKLTLLILTVIILTTFIIRYAKVVVGQQPVFADEAIYVRWAQVMKAEPTLRFLPLSDGKQPLYMWILMFLLDPSFDPLITGRLLSVIFGTITCLGVFILSYLLFRSKKVSLTATLMYAVSPYMVFFDSMALVDATLSMFAVWFFLFLYLTIKVLRFDLSMISGFLLGGALLTKSPALYFSLLTPVTLFIYSLGRNLKEVIVKNIRYIFLLIPIIGIGYGMYNVLRLGPNFHLISQRNTDYVFPLSQLWINPKDPFIFHVKEIGEWLWMLGPGVLIFTIVLGLVVGSKFYKKETIILLAWIIFPLFASAMYAKVFTARYMLFVMPFIYILSSLFIHFKTKFNKLGYLMLFLFLVNSLLVNYLMIFDIEKAPLPKSERTGYLEEWTAGYGIKETAFFLKDYERENPGKKIVVGTEGFFGTLPDGLQMYLSDHPEITVIGVGLDIKTLPNSLVESKAYGNKTFLVINSSRLVGKPNEMGLKLIREFPKPLRTLGTHDFVRYGPRESLYVFEVI